MCIVHFADISIDFLSAELLHSLDFSSISCLVKCPRAQFLHVWVVRCVNGLQLVRPCRSAAQAKMDELQDALANLADCCMDEMSKKLPFPPSIQQHAVCSPRVVIVEGYKSRHSATLV